jgi:hypothetical protein
MDFELSAGILAAGPVQQAYYLGLTAKADLRRRMAHVHGWSVREGGIGEFDAPEILGGYRSANPVHEPRLGDVLRLPDGSGPWRIIDWTVADRVDAAGNVLVVESVVDQAA